MVRMRCVFVRSFRRLFIDFPSHADKLLRLVPFPSRTWTRHLSYRPSSDVAFPPSLPCFPAFLLRPFLPFLPLFPLCRAVSPVSCSDGTRRASVVLSPTSATLSVTNSRTSSRRFVCFPLFPFPQLDLTPLLCAQWAVASLSAGAIVGTLIGGSYSDKFVFFPFP
jgi:hypothetical protein